MLYITTKEELKQAIDKRIPEFSVSKELGKKIIKMKEIGAMSKAGLSISAGQAGKAVSVVPSSLDASVLTVAAITGKDVATIILATAIGITLVNAVHKEYNCTELENGIFKIMLKNE